MFFLFSVIAKVVTALAHSGVTMNTFVWGYEPEIPIQLQKKGE